LDLAKKTKSPHSQLDEDDARQLLLLLSYGDRLCRRRKNSDRALMVGGRGVKLSDQTLVKNSEFFIALNGVEGSSEADTLVTQASGIAGDFLFKHFKGSIITKKVVVFDSDKSNFYQHEFKTLWGLPLEEPKITLASSAEVAAKLPEILTENWEDALLKNKDLKEWVDKLIFLRYHEALLTSQLQEELAGIFEGNALSKLFCLDAFTQACLGESKIGIVLQKNLVYFFELNLSAALRTILQIELPNKLKVPSGSMIPIHYSSVTAPFLEVRIQEIFGWNKTPTILFQRIPIVLHLLGPNFRPVQITRDLESFWQTGYTDVRKELRIRYPKHQWPENPADGIAQAKGRRQR
jgi:ATP-dependent helicase HrpB